MFETFFLPVFHARFERPLMVGTLVMLLAHVCLVSRFAIPRLERHQRKHFVAGVFSAFLVFVAAVIEAYTRILPSVTALCSRESNLPGGGVVCGISWGYESYMSMALWVCFGFGFLWEWPILAALIGFFGMTNAQWLSQRRPLAYAILLGLSAVSAPTPDPLTFLVQSAPVILLYEVCCGIVWLFDRHRERREAFSAFV